LALQQDGKILGGGNFGSIAGMARTNFVRLNNPQAAAVNLTYDGSNIFWHRTGTALEVWRTTFETSTNATDWAFLGEGTKVPGGWQIAAAALPVSAVIRARGQATAGASNRSGSLAETVLALSSRAAPFIHNLSADSQVSPNQFDFDIGGIDGQIVVIESSSNLVQWTSLSTNVIANGGFHFSTASSQEVSSSFYRAKLWP
jgi:hypothetical protein